jgi:hypothetical protein
MTNRIRACLPAATLRLAVFFGLAAATLTGTLAYPAYADDHDNRNRQWNESQREHARQQAWQQERWREAHRYNDYYRQPDVYYSAPPVVYQPPGYYQQPGASLNFSFPFFYH